MGDFPHYFDIFLFAMVAVFLVLRLRSVLGRRTGNERRRDPFAQPPAPAADKVVSLPQRPTPAPSVTMTSPPAGTVAGGLGLQGKSKVKAGTPPVPEQAVRSVKADLESTKQHVKEGRR